MNVGNIPALVTIDATITQAVVSELFLYDETTGGLVWRMRPETSKHLKIWNQRYAGFQVSWKDRHGYICLRLRRKIYRAHRMIWFLVHGVWPTCDIDHINGNRSDNRLHNLRLATRSQNNHNRHAPRAAIHGKGVTFHKASGRFRAYLNINHKQISFGYFDTVEEAKDAYATCAPKMLGQFHSEEATQ